MSKEPVLLVLKVLEGCPACAVINKIWPSIAARVRDDILLKNINIVVVNNKTLGPINTTNLPKTLIKLNQYYPVFAMVRGDLWNSALELINRGIDDSIVDITEDCEIMGMYINEEAKMIPDMKSKYQFKMGMTDEQKKDLIFDWIGTAYVNVEMGWVPCFKDNCDLNGCNTTKDKQTNQSTTINTQSEQKVNEEEKIELVMDF